jgi:hypothetical protein
MMENCFPAIHEKNAASAHFPKDIIKSNLRLDRVDGLSLLYRFGRVEVSRKIFEPICGPLKSG